MIDVEQILRSSDRMLLVDWPDISVPRKLLEAGFEVFGVSPKGYSRAKLSDRLPNDALPGEHDRDIEFERLERPPDKVDIVHVYRPSEELPRIIESQGDRTGAGTLWLQPPLVSAEAEILCGQRQINLIDGVDIVETIQRLGIRK